ncbi:MAG: KEOPS complex subunit Cgi121 [Thaumarchaeota archaeon]|nr:KEOPS complex subunit Cgi121 [Candidatus Calditenuaceae archaeon]MDW8043214.1 KEOPS complex subunit Cgi121 [Nitrososphaerota archaeon]
MIYEEYVGYMMLACGMRVGVADPIGALSELELPEGVRVQLYDPRAAASERQIALAFLCAVDSFLTGTNRARRIEVEVLRYLACSTQIEQAIARAGVREGAKEVGVMVIAEKGHDPKPILEEVVRALRGELAPEIAFRAEPRELLERRGLDPRRADRLPWSEGARREELLLLEEMVALRL